MFNKFKMRKKNRVGIDIGSYAVKAVEIIHGEKNALKIKNVGYARIEDAASPKSAVQAIKKAAGMINISGKQAVNIAVSGPSVIVRFVELPHMNKDELNNAIPFEAEKYIPFDINEVIIDYQMLIPRLTNNQMLVLLAVAKKDIINERLNLLKDAGLQAGILGISSFANINAFLEKTPEKEGGVTALIDVGAKATDINIMDAGVLYFTRSVQMGGGDITKVLAEAMSLEYKAAEETKLNPGDKAALVAEKIQPVLRNILDEIKLSFSYYENQSGKNVEKARITGGCARISGIYPMFKEGLGLELKPWDPLEGVEVDAAVDAGLVKTVKDQMGVAVGLALR